ncbi:MmgE/PrpD family protein [Jiella endophytica]|uniref:MmgE/PrpD family protein n=1 Tax=Jiella endophytica TaxID=2558362 RepID=A0A4Y8RGZ9_9HYPH|nr:MmgE/PrpD family protein [Jiella endophytica]TFF22033.1 MmgE/PrpD family protein [Jiella endophytica]
MTIAADLARFTLSQEPASEAASRFTALSLFDWATAGLAGRDEPVSRAARAMALGEGAAGGATLIGGGKAHPRAAALANGAISHALDYDDTHFLHIGHPSVVVMSAALAVAEVEGSSGPAFRAALTRGLELTCRVGDWLGRSHYEAGFHQTGTAGAFGATAAAGRLLGLGEDAMTSALGLATTRAAGLKSQMGTMAKPLNAGFAAEVGVTCALLARHGVVSNPEAFEDAQGFGPTHAGSDRRQAFDGMGREWVFPGISYKHHACCHGLHAMLECLAEIKAGGVDPGSVERIAISTNPRWFAVCNKPEPVTGLEAKFSYRLTAAMALHGVDTADLGAYTEATCRRADLVALRDRVVVEADAELADTASRVVVELKDGTRRSASHDLAARPDPERTALRLKAKSATLLGDARSEALWQVVSTLDQDAVGLAGLAELLGETR